jgi:hypothetical protein
MIALNTFVFQLNGMHHALRSENQINSKEISAGSQAKDYPNTDYKVSSYFFMIPDPIA